MAIDKNRVELAGIVSKVRGGYTRYGGYWLLMEVEVEEEGRSNTFPVWWFGGREDNDLYTSVAEGYEVEIVGQVKWGKNSEDVWELRIQALTFGVTERASRKKQERNEHGGRSERNGRNERRERTERRERNGRSKPYPPDEEAPF